MRDTLFISHANPQDNEFTAWLISRLQRLGYKAWCDLNGLIGGERDFWLPIEEQLRNNAVKFLLVLSNSTFSKNGVLDEYEFARSLADSETLKDFILPLRIQNIPFNSRIGLNRYNQINFVDSWADGLKQLQKKLQDDSIPKDESISYDNITSNYTQILKLNEISLKTKKEYHYSSFWKIKSYPKSFFINTFYNNTQAKHIFESNKTLPIVIHGNNIVSFEKNLDLRFPNSEEDIQITNHFEIAIESILNREIQNSTFPNLEDCENLLKRLFNRTLHLYLKNRGLYWFELSSKNNCYYYPKDLIKKNKVTFNYHNRKKTKNILGTYLYDNYWHFGLSYKTRLEPFISYSFKTHILFSTDGKNIWTDKSKLHKARRKKGKKMFNEEWRDHLFAFLNGLQNEDSKIELSYDSVQKTSMPLLTETFISKVGYTEPKTKSRIDLLNTYPEEEEYYSEDEL